VQDREVLIVSPKVHRCSRFVSSLKPKSKSKSKPKPAAVPFRKHAPESRSSASHQLTNVTAHDTTKHALSLVINK
jgi:hypothetical protein